jgi:hypothetical protein
VTGWQQQRRQSGGGGGSTALAVAVGRKRGMRGCSVGGVMEAARQRRGNGGQCVGSVGNARVAEAAQRRCWMRRWQVGRGGSRAAGRRQRRQQSGGGSMATAAAERQRLWQCGGGCGSARKRGGGGISEAEARSQQAAWQRRLQHGVSGSSTVVALAERQRQRGRGAETAGSQRQ